jgi:hypothetical protein
MHFSIFWCACSLVFFIVGVATLQSKLWVPRGLNNFQSWSCSMAGSAQKSDHSLVRLIPVYGFSTLILAIPKNQVHLFTWFWRCHITRQLCRVTFHGYQLFNISHCKKSESKQISFDICNRCTIDRPAVGIFSMSLTNIT